MNGENVDVLVNLDVLTDEVIGETRGSADW